MNTASPSPQFVALQRVIAGRFSLERVIGRGGSAVIYLARDVTLNRPVAIKVLDPDAASQPALRGRFTHEARTAGVLSQPNIVPIHAVEEHGDIVFFVMGYVDGEGLGQRIKRTGMLEIAEATRMLREVAWALGYAHARGIIHRDIKPDNIMIERDTGRALVTDFGIARHVDDQQGGEIVGTADYMSPEQAAGQDVDTRSDIYSLGVTAFFSITGRLPFNAPTDEGVMRLHVTQPPPSVTEFRMGVPGRVVEIVDRCLAKRPADRFATAEELAAALGDAAGTIHHLPAVVGDFLEVAHRTSRSLIGLAPLGGILTYAFAALQGFGPGHLMLVVFIGWIVVLEFLRPPLALLQAARGVLAEGITYDEFREILMVQATDTSGTRAASGGRGTPRGATRGFLLGAGALVVAVAALVIAGVVPEAWRLGITSIAVSGVILASGTLGLAVFTLLGGQAHAMTTYSLWLSGFGARFFRLAALGLPKTTMTERLSIRQPEALLSQDVRSTLAELDGLEQREEILAVINTLETRVGALRADRDRVDIGPKSPADGKTPRPFPRITPARPTVTALRGRDTRLAANREIEVAMAALESIRLNLVRIRSGVGSHADLTSDLAAARHTVESRTHPAVLAVEREA